MSKKVLILSSSPRKGGNSDSLCGRFADGALEAGHTVETIRLAEKKIGYCTGCYACQTGTCPQKDDTAEILEKMLDCDVMVLATPVYFYSMCAQLKALIDRSVAIYPQLAKKEFYYIMTMADTNDAMFRGTLEALRGFLACCEGSVEKGVLHGLGVYHKDEVQKTAVWDEAYQMGRGV